MDRKSILALVLISVIIIGWMVYMSVSVKPVPKEEKSKTEQTDTTNKSKTADTIIKSSDTASVKMDSKSDTTNVYTKNFSKFGAFTQFTNGSNQTISIENKLAKIEISSKGASLQRYELKNYKKWSGTQVQLINTKKGELFLKFRSKQNNLIDSRDLYFTTDFNQTDVKLAEKDSLVITYTLQLDADSKIIKKLTFYGNGYIFHEDITFVDMEEYIPSYGYRLVWDNGLRYQEKNSVDESNSSNAYVSLNGDLDNLDANDEGKQSSSTGLIDYAAIKTKYFTTAIIPSPYKSFDGTVDLEGHKKHFANEGQNKIYSMEFRLPYSGGIESKSFDVYVGPLDYKIVKKYQLQGLVDLGWKYGIRQIGEYFMLPIFNLIHSFIHNYGISIILFAFLIKLLLYPLSIGQMRSAHKMKLVTPIVNEVREKYKDDNTKQQQEVMKVYSEYGINPAGGCLPLLLQMPILYALWSVLRSAIDLRQAPFGLWIKDLSTPDFIVNFGFSFMGISSLSGLALLMGVTLFIQQKQTITDPRQKSMVYIMPVMLTLIFNYLPSGLNLYYFTFNIVSIAMQVYVNKYSKNQPTLAELKKSPKKEGWMQRKMREAQDIAAKQGRTLPGQTQSKSVQGQKKVQQGKQKKK